MASAPSGWKWDKKAHAGDGDPAPSGWSWNQAQVVSTGSGVTLAGETSTVTVAPPADADPTVGESVVTATTDDNTLLGFRNTAGEISWVPLGWSWNE